MEMFGKPLEHEYSLFELLRRPEVSYEAMLTLGEIGLGEVEPAVREQVTKGLFNKGVRLGELGKSDEAIAVYDALDQRFGQDTAPGVREQVASGLNGKGFNQILLAKQMWVDLAMRGKLLASATDGLQRALLHCSKDERAMVLGNLGYAQFLAGEQANAHAATLECLQLGGQTMLDAQRADAKIHRVEDVDNAYEQMLDNLWATLPKRDAPG